MPSRPDVWKQRHRATRTLLLLLLVWLVTAGGVRAAPQASFVMDARTGEVLLAENADSPLHPASLTKMMTLYVAFRAIEAAEIGLDEIVVVSAHAAAVPGSRLGLQAGERISLRHLIRAVAIRSANDAATALAEGLAGSEAAFVARMNAQAAALGLTGTAFRNPHGLTAAGHLTSARDMSELGRRLHIDFPDYWALFSRLSAEAAGRRISHTNRRFLSSYAGADGIKTGYTRAAGYTLTASARRGNRHLIVTVFGAPSSEARAALVATLMDAAFPRIPDEAPVLYSAARGEAAPASGAEWHPTATAERPTPWLADVRPLFGTARADAAPPNAPLPAAPQRAPARPGGLPLSALKPTATRVPPGG